MKQSRFSDSQTLAILNQAKFGGMDVSLMSRLKQLESENQRLKKMCAEERLKSEIIQEAMAKKW